MGVLERESVGEANVGATGGRPIRAGTAAWLAAGLLAVSLFALQPAEAAPGERARGAVETILGGSVFPFRRSFAPPTPRCRALARKLRNRHNDGFLTVWDFQELRRKGCGGAG